jgi:ParB/RepB/Spo0J family partition protein
MNESKLLQVPTERCAPAPWANRADLNLTPEFLADIKKRGVRQSLEVRLVPGQTDRYEIIAGVRRWSAAVKAKLDTVPVTVVAASDQEGREGRLIENLQREDLTALDEAQQYQEALASGDYGEGAKAVETLAAKVGKSRSHIYARLRMTKLNPAVAKALTNGKIDQTVAELISTIPGDGQQEKALKEILIPDHRWNSGTGKSEKVPKSFRDVRNFIDAKFRKSLKGAPFKLSDSTLASKPACVDCPHRTGNMPGVLSASPDICTMPSCYAEKVEAHQTALLAGLKAKGKTVLTGKDAPKWQYGSLAYNSGYVDAGGHHWVNEKQQPYTKLLGKLMPEILHAVNPDGNVVALCRETDLRAAMVKAGVVKPDRKSDPAMAKAEREKEQREEAIRECEVTRIIDACMKVVENPKLNDRQHALLWAFVFRKFHACKDNDSIERMRHRHNCVRDVLDRVASVRPDADMNLEGVRGYAIEALLLEDYGADYNEEDMNDLAKLCKVDTAAIAKTVRAEFAAAEKKSSVSRLQPVVNHTLKGGHRAGKIKSKAKK